VSLLELELGIRVFIRPIHSSISGVFAFDPQVGACVLLNANHPRDRRATSAAHEMGHFVSSRETVDVYTEDWHSGSREERFANAFASSFLMPAAAIRQRFREISTIKGKFSARHLILLAHGFHVSVEAMCRRLEALELLPKGSYESLRERGLSQETVHQVLGDSPPDNSITMPPRLAFLAVEAYERRLLSEGQICEKLQMDRVEVRRLIDVLGAEDSYGSEALGT
jgi:Zn-dependent peptidase ImmA (M78 family)